MRSNLPAVSVIIPTHNRSTWLRRTLDALGAQTYPSAQLEVIVVADGCTDQTVALLQQLQPAFSLRFIDQLGSGPAAARNNGAALAKGDLLIFLDDDIEVAPGFVEAHVQAHCHESNRVAIGYLPVMLENQRGFFRAQLQLWWEAMFEKMRQPAHRYAYSDLLSGNFSVSADLFTRLGGFDTSLWCHEDYELGLRLLKAGANFVFVPEAMGYHYEVTDLDRSLRRKYQEGQADVLLGERHPEIRFVLPLAYFHAPSGRLERLLRTLVFAQPAVGNGLATALRRSLDLLETLHLRGRWRRLLEILLGYWYWRGVAEVLKTRQALMNFLEEEAAVQPPLELELDLRDGLEMAEQCLDAARPEGLRLRYGQHVVGHILPQPGTERLRGDHLRPILANQLAYFYLVALTLGNAAGDDGQNDLILSKFPVFLHKTGTSLEMMDPLLGPKIWLA